MKLSINFIWRSSIAQLSLLMALVAGLFYWYFLHTSPTEESQERPSKEHLLKANLQTVYSYIASPKQDRLLLDGALEYRYQLVEKANPDLSYYYEKSGQELRTFGAGPRKLAGIDLDHLLTISATLSDESGCFNIHKRSYFTDEYGMGLLDFSLCGDQFIYEEISGISSPTEGNPLTIFKLEMISKLRLSDRYVYLALGIFSAALLVFVSVFWSLFRLGRLLDGYNPEQKGALLPTKGVPAEATPLIHALNNMMQRVDEYEERRDFFVAVAAHEIRSPLAVITALAEELPKTQEQQKILANTQRLATLTKQLMALVKANSWSNTDTVADLVKACDASIAFVADSAELKQLNIQFIHSSVEDWYVVGDQNLIELAITNVLHNAIAHSLQGSCIIVELDDSGQITITDAGPGIDPKKADTIFEPFTRFPKNGKGYGLGLAIVKAVINNHHGSVSIQNASQGGAQVLLSFQPPQESSE